MSATASPIDRHPGLSSQEQGSVALARELASPSMYRGRPAVELRETHASWVFLAGGCAYKVKKPVRLAFLDYGTLQRRHAACREEVRVNRDLAPDVYLGVLAIVRSRMGLRFAPEDAPDAVEYAVHMRRFDDAATLQGAIRERSLTRAQIRAVAVRLAEFHRDSPAVAAGAPAEVLGAWTANLDELARLTHPARWRLTAMRRFGEAFVSAHREELRRRVRDGHVRDGHGDLRCEHVLLEDPVRVVDRIEFDPAMRHMDVARDRAFLTMDLEAQRRPRAARELTAAYRRAGGSPGNERLRGFYGAYWALVRAKVALISAAARDGRAARAQRAQAARLWVLAERLCWQARQPLVIVVCGTPASGKSTLAAELARRARLPVVSSDAVRKRHAGLPATARARPEHYTREFTRITYELLSRDARAQLDRRGGVIVDATCRRRSQRALLLHRLRVPSATLLVVRCRVTRETALARAAARMQNAGRVSDATPEIVERQLRGFQALQELPSASVLELDAEQDADAQVAQVASSVDEQMASATAAGGRTRRRRPRICSGP